MRETRRAVAHALPLLKPASVGRFRLGHERADVQEIFEYLSAHGTEAVRLSCLAFGNPATEILAFAQAHNAELVVMGCYA